MRVECPLDDRGQRWVGRRPQGTDRNRAAALDRGDESGRGASAKGRPADEALVQDGAHTVEVAGRR